MPLSFTPRHCNSISHGGQALVARLCRRYATAKAGKVRGVLLGRVGAVSVLRGILPVLASIASTGSFVTHERMW